MKTQKISSLMLLFVAILNTSESCASRRCGCHDNVPDTSGIYDIIHDKYGRDNNVHPNFRLVKPTQNKIVGNENFYWNPIIDKRVEPIKHLNSDTHLSETLLKQLWKSHQKDNSINSAIRRNDIPLDDYTQTLNDFVPNNPEQVASLNKFQFDDHQINTPMYPIKNIKSNVLDYGGLHYVSENNPIHKKSTNFISYYNSNDDKSNDNDNDNDSKIPNEYDTKITPDTKSRYDKYDLLDNQRNTLPIQSGYENAIDHNPDKNNVENRFSDNLDKRYNIEATPSKTCSKTQNLGKFDEWVLEQIQILNDKNQGLDNLDSKVLGMAVLQILNENGMYISDDGTFTDTFGTVSKLDSLNLTPIAIGNTMSLKNLLRGKYGSLLKESHKPLLEAILVTASHPLKMLGIMPLGTPYSPLRSESSLKNIWANNPKNVLSRKQKLKKEDTTQGNHKNHDKNNSESHDVADYKYIYRNMITDQEKPELESEDNQDHSYGGRLLNEDSNGGRLFIPRIEIREQPIHILTRRIKRPYVTIYEEPARIPVPGLSNIIDIAFRKSNLPLQNVSSKQNAAMEITNTPIISTIVDKISNSAAVLKNVVSEKDLPLQEIIPERNLLMTDSKKPITKLNKMFLDLPDDYLNLEVSKTTGVMSEEEFGSRSGEPVAPETPPENNNENGNFDLVENNDDDDDADFRIIGGNAATGSGTPLSNRGRSGRIF